MLLVLPMKPPALATEAVTMPSFPPSTKHSLIVTVFAEFTLPIKPPAVAPLTDRAFLSLTSTEHLLILTVSAVATEPMRPPAALTLSLDVTVVSFTVQPPIFRVFPNAAPTRPPAVFEPPVISAPSTEQLVIFRSTALSF